MIKRISLQCHIIVKKEHCLYSIVIIAISLKKITLVLKLSFKIHNVRISCMKNRLKILIFVMTLTNFKNSLEASEKLKREFDELKTKYECAQGIINKTL